MTRITLINILPLYRDAGADTTALSLAGQGHDQIAFITQFNAASDLPDLTWDGFLQYLADRRAVGELLEIDVTLLDLPDAISRAVAPAGIGFDANGVWFSTPNTGVYDIWWHKNGALAVVQEDQDLSSQRSIVRGTGPGELDVGPGDVVQIALVTTDTIICGWAGRTTIT